MNKIISAKNLIEELEKSKERGYLKTITKINEGIEKYKKIKELFVIAIDLTNKKIKINGKKTFETELPIEKSYEDTYRKLIDSLVFTSKNEEDSIEMKKHLLSEEVIQTIKTKKHFLFTDKKPYMEILIEDTRYMDIGKLTIDFSN